MTLDLDRVNLNYTPGGGVTETLPRVADPAACPELGWTYDDPTAPTQLVLCPATCDLVRADPAGNVEVAFGCETIMY
jgi:hypothetical protein